MADDGLSFRRRPPAAAAAPSPRWLLLLLVAALLVYALTRPWRAASLPEGVLLEVRGDVPEPGTHLVDPPTLAAAVAAAGGDPSSWPDTPLATGARVVIDGDQVQILPPSDPLLVSLPVDLNRADADAIEAIPGIGDTVAKAIVADREARGPFRDLDDLSRVTGVGAHTLENLAPFVKLAPAGPIDVNRASAARLETLPGIGPVTAARIVVEREEGGPFVDLGDLQRVRGVGPATVEDLAGLATVGDAAAGERAP